MSELTACPNTRVFSELPQRVHRDEISRAQCLVDPRVGLADLARLRRHARLIVDQLCHPSYRDRAVLAVG